MKQEEEKKEQDASENMEASDKIEDQSSNLSGSIGYQPPKKDEKNG